VQNPYHRLVNDGKLVKDSVNDPLVEARLHVSAKQLRNRSLRDAIGQGEIGCWVFDEAHCLSKVGP
jgi:superfamily II DNA helicase RecQ